MVGKRKSRHDLPSRVYFNRGWYWYVDRTKKWHKLGREWDTAARIEWATITGEPFADAKRLTVKAMLADFIAATKAKGKRAPRTIRDYEDHAVEINRIFGAMGPDDVTSVHIAQYLDRRVDKAGQPAPVRANREISTLSSAYAWAMTIPMANRNPCYGVRRNEENPDSYAPELWEVRAVQQYASPKWAAAIELALLVGQRSVDMRKLRRNDAGDDGITFHQTKRGARVLIEWTDELRAAWSALEEANRGNKIPSVYMIPSRIGGQQLTADGWKATFSKVVGKAIAAGDIKTRFGFHSIRAANATIEDSQGGSAQKRLGHSTAQQTADYIRHRRPTKVQPLRTGTADAERRGKK